MKKLFNKAAMTAVVTVGFPVAMAAFTVSMAGICLRLIWEAE